MDTIINDTGILDGGRKLLSKKQAAVELGFETEDHDMPLRNDVIF